MPHGEGQAKVDMSYLHLVKGDHFPKTGSIAGQYDTESGTCFNFKGNASQIRSCLDNAKKEDLRKSHFKIGAPTGNFVTLNQAAYTPKRGEAHDNSKNTAYNLRHKTFRIGGQRGQYQTEQRDQYLWVQPTPSKK